MGAVLLGRQVSSHGEGAPMRRRDTRTMPESFCRPQPTSDLADKQTERDLRHVRRRQSYGPNDATVKQRHEGSRLKVQLEHRHGRQTTQPWISDQRRNRSALVGRTALAYELVGRDVPEVSEMPRGEFDSQLRMAIFSISGTKAESVSAVVQRLQELTLHHINRDLIRDALSRVTLARGAEFSAALQARAAQRIPVLYVTNRNIVDGKQLGYGTDRGRNISYGMAEVSIPEDHKYGGLESPNHWKFEFRENEKRDVIIRSTEPLKDRATLGKRLGRLSEGGPGNALVFVHGYNVTFKDAVRRAGQLAYDLQFDGVVIVFSWPSKGRSGVRAYAADSASAGAAQAKFTALLSWALDRDSLEGLHLLAHSMGNRLATNALVTIAARSPSRRAQRLKQVVLAAPDIDEQEFEDRVAAFKGVARRVTMYGSRDDVALWASAKVAQYVRAGSGGTSLVVAPGLDTIDVSPLSTDFTGHSYFGNNPAVLVDMDQLINRGTPPGSRGRLEELLRDGRKYWAFQAGR